MLNDDEREALRRVEHDVIADDPAFARSFEARLARLARVHRRRGLSVAIAVSVAFVLGTLALVSGSATGALAIMVITALIWFAWHHTGAGTS
ncbi:DUF3040 domain-containing protein [Pseudonocardia sp. GCM10023141]|uniref:DUF3040 domain-containing protein n=1 Tax=Pseudonocardia sp. GCM10023141 TaxID=3252653 RepID=UPI0036193398